MRYLLSDKAKNTSSNELYTIDTYQNYYVHGFYQRFIKGLADYFATEVFPRVGTENTIISTYSKAVEHIRNRKLYAGEKITSKYPFMIVDPNLESIEADNVAGKFLYQYYNFHFKPATLLMAPLVYEDDNVNIRMMTNRYRFSIDFILYTASVYESLDCKTFIYQMFGGLNRPTYPKSFQNLIILPDELIDFNYSNGFTGESYNLDWDDTSKANVGINNTILLKNMNKNKLCLLNEVLPWLTLVNINNNSDKYGGGADSIGDHPVRFSIEVELNLPIHLIVEKNQLPRTSIPIEIRMGMDNVRVTSPTGGIYDLYKYIQSVAALEYNDESSVEKKDLTYDEIINYVITDSDETTMNSEDDYSTIIEIPLSKYVEDERYIAAVHSNAGWLDRDRTFALKDHYTLKLYGFTVRDYLSSGDYVNIILLKDVDDDILT